MKENCINCQKEVEWERGDIFYSIYDNFDKYKDKYWCSNCLKEVQKICEGKWGVHKDCIFGENNEQFWKWGKGLDEDPGCPYKYIRICPWCEIKCWHGGDYLDHSYHFHGRDKGKCNKSSHMTEEDIRGIENWGPKYKDIRKEIYVEGSPDVNGNNDDREREREREREQNEPKCQVCKQEQCEKVVKDGSNDVLICEKCYYCSKCKTNQAIARSVVNENKILYEGTICETCIKKVIKSANEQTCEMCGEHTDNGKGICEKCEKKLPNKPHEEKNSPQHGKEMSGGVIALIVVGGLCLVVGVIYFLKKGKSGKKKP